MTPAMVPITQLCQRLWLIEAFGGPHGHDASLRAVGHGTLADTARWGLLSTLAGV